MPIFGKNGGMRALASLSKVCIFRHVPSLKHPIPSYRAGGALKRVGVREDSVSTTTYSPSRNSDSTSDA